MPNPMTTLVIKKAHKLDASNKDERSNVHKFGTKPRDLFSVVLK
jgi:hypothetical protein